MGRGQEMMEKVNMKVWLVLAKTWVWWAAIIGPAAWVCWSSLSTTGGPTAWVCLSSLSMTGGRGKHNNLSYDKLEFHVKDCTKNTYSDFLKALRIHLSSENSLYGIPFTRAQDPSGSQELLLVELFDWDNESITLVLNITNAFVIAYQAQNRYFLLNDTLENPQLYGNNPERLSFGSNYGEIVHVAHESRENILLGIGELAQAILTLHDWLPSPGTSEASVARSLIVLIQMVSEAARFRAIEQRVHFSIIDELNPTRYDSFRPGTGVMDLENNWRTISNLVRTSNEGVFGTQVAIQTSERGQINIDGVEAAQKICGLALLLDSCDRRRQSQTLLSSPHLNIVDDDTCEHSEPTVRINGRNGYCMDVKDGIYNNGNPIILWSCRGNEDKLNQLWTFKRDGTIRSNGMCLTAYGYSEGAYVMIYDCSSAVTDATLWTLYYGSLINQPSGLAIGAEPGNSGTTLTMQVHLNASKQGWLASNNTQSFLTPIIGLNDLCMQRNGDEDAVGLATCDDNNSDQKWYLYGDGSIRPLKDPSNCVTCIRHDKGSPIILLLCTLGDASQRWMFSSQGTIYNLHNGFVMDVKGSDPSLQQIIIWSSTGNPNQKWFTTF